LVQPAGFNLAAGVHGQVGEVRGVPDRHRGVHKVQIVGLTPAPKNMTIPRTDLSGSWRLHDQADTRGFGESGV
jgi:hypothetical protein